LAEAAGVMGSRMPTVPPNRRQYLPGGTEQVLTGVLLWVQDAALGRSPLQNWWPFTRPRVKDFRKTKDLWAALQYQFKK